MIGAGLAGAATAAALARRGHPVHLYDTPGAEAASRIPAAVLNPPISHPDDPLGYLRRRGITVTRAWMRSLERRNRDSGRIASGVLLVPVRERVRERHARLAGIRGSWRRLDPEQAMAAAGIRVPERSLLHLHGACVVPHRLIAGMLLEGSIKRCCVAVTSVEPFVRGSASQWQVVTADGLTDQAYPHVVLAAGMATADLLAGRIQGLIATRGQVTGFAATSVSSGLRMPVSADGYLTPAIDGVHWGGATTTRHDLDREPRDADDAANTDWVNRWWPDGPELRPVDRFVGIRATTVDRLPVAGQIATGLWANCGHGSHGLATALLCGQLVARGIGGHSHPLLRLTAPDRKALHRVRNRT